MRVICRTNLDLKSEKWPDELPTLPNIGDLIESARIWNNAIHLELEVVRITWIHRKSIHSEFEAIWIPKIELHLPRNRYQNITEFQKWYDKITF